MRLLNWFFAWFGLQLVPAEHGELYLVEREVLEMVEGLIPVVRHWDRQHGASGEFKYHQVYAQGIKLFPKAAHMDVGMAIQFALRRHRGRRR